MSLQLYKDLNFKFILCKADKTPDIPGSDNWNDEFNHLTIEQARTYQRTGKMIGAIIPPDVVILNLNRKGDYNGIAQMKQIRNDYKIEKSLLETLVVTTQGNGHHLYFRLPENMQKKNAPKPGIKAPGVELKTHAQQDGYVIAADSPGYKIFSEEISEIYPELLQWLSDCEKEQSGAGKAVSTDSGSTDETKESGEPQHETDQKKLPPRSLRSILKKMPVENFIDKNNWQPFIRSCIAVAGNSEEVKVIISEWFSESEILKNDNEKLQQIITTIRETDDPGRVSVGSFVHYLRDCNISSYYITQAVKLDSVSNTLIDAENSEIYLPFCDPDYQHISQTPAAREFFHVQGNTAAASILEMALENKVLYSDAEKTPFYFDGNRWHELNDYFGIIYTIIFRVVKIVYAETEGDKEDNDRMFKCIQKLNDTHWKTQTWKELCSKSAIFKKFIPWDSPDITETITTEDGVIDFSTKEMVARKGEYKEFRRSYFHYTTDEIMEAPEPEKFITFFNSLFPDSETLETAKYCVSMAISGNSGKRLFQLWQGIGSNGKSTLLETIKNVLGKDKSYKFPSEVLLTGAKRENYKAEIAKFQGKYFCYSSEAEKGARLSQNIIKDMTGDEAISARELYKAPVEFEATWQIIYAVNDLPAIYGDDHAFNDRLIVIPFKMFFYKDEDKRRSALRRGVDEKYMKLADNSKDFKRGLYEEKAGIIKWMIENYNYMNTHMKGVIPESEECKNKKQSYIEDNDDIGVFLDEICEIDETGGKGWYIQLEELANEFREFTGSHKKGTKSIIRDIVESHNAIERGVQTIHVYPERSVGAEPKLKQVRVLKNIQLRDFSEGGKPKSIASHKAVQVDQGVIDFKNKAGNDRDFSGHDDMPDYNLDKESLKNIFE